MKDMINVRLERIEGNPWQTRMGVLDAESVKELALDIAMNGLLQVPVGRLVTDMGEGVRVPVEVGGLRWEGNTIEMKLHEGNALRVQLAFGHRRLEAFRLLNTILDYSNVGQSPHTKDGWATMPVEIREMADEEMARLAWSENEKREGVNAADRAKAIEQWMNDFGWSQAEVGEKLGLARSTVANILRLGGLPGNMLEALRQGLISERVGMALLPMYRLPESTMKLAEAGWGRRPSRIEREALEGYSSDLIRRNVEELYSHYTKKLQDAKFGLDEPFKEYQLVGGYDHDASEAIMVYCGLCRTCDRRLKDQGNICLDPNCYTAKTTLHRRAYLAKAAGHSGIPAVDPNKGGSVTDLPYTEETAAKIIGSKCENLRLVYDQSNRDDHRNLVGHPHARIVCDKRNGSCTCIKGLEIAARQKEPSKAVEQAVQADKETAREYSGADYEGDDPEEDLVRMIDEEKEAEVRTQTEQPKALSPKELEEAARQARKEKARMGEETEKARMKVLKVLEEAFRDHQPGALYLVAMNYPYPNRGELDLQKIHKRLAGNVLHSIVPSAANTVDELYGIINNKLEKLEIDQVYPLETLMETFAKEENEQF